ncbi:MAG: hypothetical protein V1725_07055 [archaeon]
MKPVSPAQSILPLLPEDIVLIEADKLNRNLLKRRDRGNYDALLRQFSITKEYDASTLYVLGRSITKRLFLQENCQAPDDIDLLFVADDQRWIELFTDAFDSSIKNGQAYGRPDEVFVLERIELPPPATYSVMQIMARYVFKPMQSDVPFLKPTSFDLSITTSEIFDATPLH